MNFDNIIFFSWVSASTGLIAFILFLPGIFVEHSCSDSSETNVDGSKTRKDDDENIKTNRDSVRSEYKRQEGHNGINKCTQLLSL